VKPMTILHVVGARPNFMKVAPVYNALALHEHFCQLMVHTGQHYDANMSDVFFRQLAIPAPDINLGIGSGSHSVQTARMMIELEQVITDRKPDLVVVYGDVNSTVAAALVCAKLLVPVAHVEAGLRSGDRTMPEEINRLLTDQIADLLFTPSVDGNENLAREGIAPHKVHLVGNVMIDTLLRLLPQTEGLPLPLASPFALVTLHRPSNVDRPEMLAAIVKTLQTISCDIPVLFSVHPRTRQRLEALDIQIDSAANLHLLGPVGYLEFLALQRHATLVITDSGGIQEETTYLGIPCLTVRENTERPITVSVGTNQLVGQDMTCLLSAVESVLAGRAKKGTTPLLWDGKASERIANIITSL